MTALTRSTPKLIDLLKQYEGFKPIASPCVSGGRHPDGSLMYDIGFGCQFWEDGEPVRPGDEIGHFQAEQLLQYKVDSEFNEDMEDYFKGITFGPNMSQAMRSIWYNLRAPREQPIMKAIRAGQYGRHVEMTGELAERWMKYHNPGNETIREGVYKRRAAEVLLGKGLPDPFENSQRLGYREDVWPLVQELQEQIGLPVESPSISTEPEPMTDLYEGYEDPTPEDDWTTADYNEIQRRKLAGIKPVAVSRLTKKVPVQAVDYLSEENKAEPTVKPIESSQRGKGYAKTQTAKEVGITGAAGTAAVAIGAAEPVVQFVDKYPATTIGYVFGGLMLFAVIYYFYGLWQRQKGEDEAQDLLG